MRKHFHKTLAVIAMVMAIGISPALVKAGAFTGAQEWTQIMNNIELVLSNMTENEQLATQLEDYATQLEKLQVSYQQYDTMQRNLKKFDQRSLDMVLGAGRSSKDSEIQKYLNLAQAANRISQDSKVYVDSMKRMQQTGDKLALTPSAMLNVYRQSRGAQREYLESQAKILSDSSSKLEADVKSFDDIYRTIDRSDGAVASIDNVAASNVIVGRIASETRQSVDELVRMKATEMTNNLDAEQLNTEALDKARRRQSSAFTIVKPSDLKK